MYCNAAEHDESNDGLDRGCEELCLIGGWVGRLGEISDCESGDIHSP